MGVIWSQFFPPPPLLTETNLPLQNGKIFLITGGYSGVGLELASILYGAGAKVYMAGRPIEKYNTAVDQIRQAHSNAENKGTLDFLHLELDDLDSISASVEAFQRKESKIYCLWNNAGVSLPPENEVKGKSGHELMLATNVLGAYMFSLLCLPLLRAAAETSPPASTRVVWTGSIVVDLQTPRGGFPVSELQGASKRSRSRYCHTKLGNWMLASEFGARVKQYGILSVVQNPGNLKMDILRHMSALLGAVLSPLLYEARYGAYTALYAGLSKKLTMEDSGKYILPWGRIHPAPRQDLLDALKRRDDGGTGFAEDFWAFCEEQCPRI